MLIAKKATATATTTVPRVKARRHSRCQKYQHTIGPASRMFEGLENVAIPSSSAATTSVA
jgi:hypothetical protein